MVTSGAKKIIIKPAPCFRRNSVAHGFLLYRPKFAAAQCAAWLPERQMEFRDHKLDLFTYRQGRREPKSGYDPIADQPPFHDPAIGSENCTPLRLRTIQEFSIVQPRMP